MAKTPDAVAVKAIARASVWFEHLTTGKSQSMAEIAVRENITDNYVSNLMHLAWLSPDLVGRVLDGDPEGDHVGQGRDALAQIRRFVETELASQVGNATFCPPKAKVTRSNRVGCASHRKSI